MLYSIYVHIFSWRIPGGPLRLFSRRAGGKPPAPPFPFYVAQHISNTCVLQIIVVSLQCLRIEGNREDGPLNVKTALQAEAGEGRCTFLTGSFCSDYPAQTKHTVD